jgi:YD repeat-containing protein
VDDQGVIFLHEAGLLLSYPFPVPGEPVLPVQGPRWPLTLEPDGTYTVRDSDGHRSWTFARPESGIARLTTIGDRNGHRITFEYDEQGTPAGVVHDGGYEIKVSTRDGRVAALHLAGAGSGGTDLEIVRYGYDGAG